MFLPVTELPPPGSPRHLPHLPDFFFPPDPLAAGRDLGLGFTRTP